MRSDVHENYILAAISRESAIVAAAQSSTRNHTLNRAAFRLARIPNMATETAVSALLIASRTNGYLKEHGEIATRKVIESGLRNGKENLRQPPGGTLGFPNGKSAMDGLRTRTGIQRERNRTQMVSRLSNAGEPRALGFDQMRKGATFTAKWPTPFA